MAGDDMNTETHRTTIVLSKENHEKIRRIAFEKRTSIGEFIRTALVRQIEDEEDLLDATAVMASSEGWIDLEEYMVKRGLKKE